MAVTIDSLELEILDNSEAVIAGLEKLKATLSGFKTLTSTTGFAKMSKQLGELSAAVNKMPGTQKMKEFAEGLSAMAAVPKANISKSLANQITAIGSAAASLDAAAMSNLRDLKNALQPLTELGKPQLTSFITQLKKLPEVATAFKNINMDAFAASIQKVTVAIRPLADEMAKVGAGFSALPSKIQRIIKSNESLSTANLKAGKTFGVMGTGISSLQAKFGIYYAMFSRAANVMGGWVNKSNDYVENLNLFTVSMGQYAGEALKYAEQVQSAMGIDMSEWIRTQGIFMQLGTGFGVAKDKAYQMSKALTQISYDLSSYFNIDIASAQDKVKSGFAGELEPLRNLGYALDQATLQQVAYKNGIQQSVNAMTQAQKSQLRYIAIMEQSRNVMGDMGRTLMTPANATRILGQQTTQLTRALGNMLIPMLMQIVPYVQAVVVVLTEAAQAIANLFGFTIPTIDYSGLDGLASGTGDVTAGLEEATSAAKELNGSLAFDELNIISKNNAPAGGGVGGGGDLGLDMGKFDYDFLGEAQSKVNEIAQSIRDFFSKWKDEIATIAKLLVGLWAVKKIADMVNWVKKLYTSFQALSIVKTISGLFSGFLQTFDLFYASGAGFFKSFDNGLRSIGDSMTGMQKFVGSVVALGVEFIIVKDVVRDLTLGQKNWTEALLILVPTCAAVGVAMYAMLGPVGLVLTAVVGVTAAVIGFNEAQKQMQTEFIQAEFFDGVGISISEFTGIVAEANSSINATSQEILRLGENLVDADSMVLSTNSAWMIYRDELSETGRLTAEHAQKMKDSIKQMTDGIKQNLELDKDIIFAAFTASAQQAAKDLGASVSEMTRLLEDFQRKFGENVDSASARINDLLGKSVAVGLTPAEQAELDRLFDYTSEMATRTSETQVKLRQQMEDIGKLDFEEPKVALEAIAELGRTGKTALDDLEASNLTAKASLETLKHQLDTDFKFGHLTEEAYQEGLKLFSQYSSSIAAGYENNKAAIETSLNTATGAILSQLDGQLQGIAEQTPATFGDKWSSAWKAAFSGDGLVNGQDYLPEVIKGNVEKSVGEPIRAAVNELIAGFNGIVTPDVEAGKAMMEGLAKGTNENAHLVTKAVTAAGEGGIKAIETVNDSHSPSKVYFAEGLNMMQGLANGVKENSNLAINEIIALSKEMAAQMDNILSNVKSAVSDIIDEVNRAKRAIDSLNLGDIDVNVSGKISGYSTGGYPESGELFYAHENGVPEFVGRTGNRTVVANGNNLESGIAAGNAEQNALLYEQNNLLRELLAKNTTIEIDGNEVGRSVDRYNSNKGYSVGGAFANLY